jgi:hypothetical protein
MRFSQTMVRDSHKGRELSQLTAELMKDFCDSSNTPFLEGFNIAGGAETWLIDKYGNFKGYEVEVHFESPILTHKLGWREYLSQLFLLLSRLCWIIFLLVILRDLFIR